MGAPVKVRCPSCKGNSFTLFERLEVANLFRVEAGEALDREAEPGMPHTIGFTARCDCGHDWVPRHPSAMQIVDASEVGRELSA